MQSRTNHDLQTAATHNDIGLAGDSELSILRDVFRLLPTGVTVQDEHGRFLLVNDAAACSLESPSAGRR
jgi:c-di-GMP phosphodiesterase Gmr